MSELLASKKRVILDDDTLAGLTGEFEGMRNAFQRNMPTARMVPIEIKDAINVAHALEELRNRRRVADETNAPRDGRFEKLCARLTEAEGILLDLSGEGVQPARFYVDKHDLTGERRAEKTTGDGK